MEHLASTSVYCENLRVNKTRGSAERERWEGIHVA